MTDAELFNKLFNGGNYALPYLIHLTQNKENPDFSIYLVNNNEDVTYNSQTYEASTFTYTPPKKDGSGASLSITGIDNDLINLVEECTDNILLEVVGAIAENGEVYPVKCYRHFHGSVSYGNDMKLEFNLGRDDRLDLQFLPYILDTDNNRANA